MNIKKTTLFVLLIVFACILSACGGNNTTATQDTGDTSPVAQQETRIVADGRLVPRQYAYLQFLTSGKVAEIPVGVGQRVEQGQILVHLERTDEIDLAIEQARYELRSAERAEDIASTWDKPAAEARVAAAQIQLRIAEAAPADLEIKAPFSGTIVELDLYIGQEVSAGQNALLLADLSSWFIETDNLTEIEVVDIEIGQPVTVVPDSLPNVSMTGEVVAISQVFEEKRGDITFTVRIAIGIVDPRLRWGMTVAVTFE